MAPKRAGKAEKDAGAGKKARTSGARASGSDGSRSKVSEGITERQLASFSEVSAEVNSGRLLPAQSSLGSNSSHTGFDSLLAAAGAQAQAAAAQPANVLGIAVDHKVALQLLQMQQQSSGISLQQGYSSHPLGAAPPTGIAMNIGSAHDLSAVAGALGGAGGLGLDEASATQLRAMLQSGAFSAYNVHSLLQAQAQMSGQSSSAGVLQMPPQYTLQPGTGALPPMVSLDAHGKSPFTPRPDFTFAAINAVNVDAAQDPHSAALAAAGPSVAARPDAKPEGNAGRSHGPSADRCCLFACAPSAGAASACLRRRPPEDAE